MPDPKWLEIASKLIGTKETKGIETTPAIAEWLKYLNAWWKDDETPWCGVFVAYCMKQAGISLPKDWMRAKAWSNWGVPLPQPVRGCVVVFSRDGGGHVGFVVGVSLNGNLLVLGGNQKDMVKVSEFELDRVLGYYWPKDSFIPSTKLAVMQSDGKVSTNEA